MMNVQSPSVEDNQLYLSYQEQNNTFGIIKSCFKDVQYFDALISKKLKLYLADLTFEELMTKHKDEPLLKKYYDLGYFKSPEKQPLLKFIKLAFKCSKVLILLLKGIFQHLLWTNEEQLIEAYPAFRDSKDLGMQELMHLLNFRNTMRVALEIIPAKATKQLLIDIAGRLEGSVGAGYITGSGETAFTRRRVKIYEQEGRVKPVPKAPKSTNGKAKQPCVQHNYVSPATAKAIQLTDEDIARASMCSSSDSLDFPPNIFDDRDWPILSNEQNVSVEQLLASLI
eukprot:gene37614-50780_t